MCYKQSQHLKCFLVCNMHCRHNLSAVCRDAAPVLEQETAELKRIIDHKFPHYDSDDPLDLGEACWLAHWFPEEEWSQVCKRAEMQI